MEHSELLNSTATLPSPRSTSWAPRLRRTEAAQYLRERHGIPVSPATLAKWFCLRSDGPPAYVAGRVPLYPREALDAWAEKRLGPLRVSTSNLAA